jgi:hypothetical protein
MLVDGSSKFRIGHIGPGTLIESRRFFERGAIYVEDELMFAFVDAQFAPGDSEKLVTDPEESPERQYRVRDPAGGNVEHDVLDFAQVFAG